MTKKENILNVTLIKNIASLYGLTFAKIVFPLITLPYLTRVLSVECYGTVAYVKSVMQYAQIFIDFGFLLSASKDIVKNRDDNKKMGEIVGNVIIAKLILSIIMLLILVIMCFSFPLLKENVLFTILSFLSIVCSIFLFDFFFRGIEEMQVSTIRFVITKAISTILTFVVVHDNSDLLFIPILDIISSVCAIIFVFHEFRKYKICISFSSFKDVLITLKESAMYFLSNVATTIFGALTTLVIGLFLPSTDIAFWSLCTQLIGGVQSIFTPITSGIYPEMVKRPRLSLIKRLLIIFMPLICVGTGVCICLSELILQIVGGIQYIKASTLFISLMPVVVIGFPGMLLGWPTLGGINKVKEVTISTVASSVVQILGLVLLIVTNNFTLYTIAIVRNLTEFTLFGIRAGFVYKYRRCFLKE